MKVLNIDASGCRDRWDIYDLVGKAVEAPDGHGSGSDAFADSMIWGGMNAVEPPYTVRISGTANLPDDIKTEILEFAHSLREARAEYKATRGNDVEVNVEVLP